MIEINVEFPQRDIIQATAEVNEQKTFTSDITINAKPEITGVTASVDNNTGTPYVDVTPTGTGTEYSFNLAFHNLKGDKGEQGETGEQGPQGIQGETGADGYSPVATVSQSGSVTTISITDKNGTTTESIDLSDKQDLLVSGTNIKTINNQSILGSGNITIQGGGGGGTATDVQINGTSITSSNVANIITETAYNSSTNKIATMSDLPTVPTNYVTTDTAQTISARKTFTGEKAIYFKQSTNTDKLGFTLYNSGNTEVGAFEYRPNTISSNALIAINTSYANSAYVGFRYWGTAVNIVAPKVATSGDYYIPTHITDGNTTVTANNTGTVNISTLLPTVPTKISDLTDDTSTTPIDKAKSVKDQRDSSSLKYWTGTKSQYDAIVTKDSDTVYNITDDTEQYIDNKANTSLNNITTNAKSNIVGYSMPSSTYIDITVDSSGFSYTAPANGYIYVVGESTATNGRIEIFTSMLGTKCVTPVASNSVRGFVPIVEGDIVYFYYASVSFNTCRFVYAQGEV